MDKEIKDALALGPAYLIGTSIEGVTLAICGGEILFIAKPSFIRYRRE